MSAFFQSGLKAGNPRPDSSEDRLTAVDEALRQVRAGDSFAVATLDKLLADGVRWMLKRKLARDQVEELVSFVLMLVAEAARSGCITSGAQVPGFLRTAVSAAIHNDNNPPADLPFANGSSVRLVKHILEQLPEREQKALVLYYSGQPLERICDDLGFSSAEFAVLRSRTKARYRELQAKGVENTLKRLSGLFLWRVA